MKIIVCKKFLISLQNDTVLGRSRLEVFPVNKYEDDFNLKFERLENIAEKGKNAS